jgi:hypothetical protein
MLKIRKQKSLSKENCFQFLKRLIHDHNFKLVLAKWTRAVDLFPNSQALLMEEFFTDQALCQFLNTCLHLTEANLTIFIVLLHSHYPHTVLGNPGFEDGY